VDFSEARYLFVNIFRILDLTAKIVDRGLISENPRGLSAKSAKSSRPVSIRFFFFSIVRATPVARSAHFWPNSWGMIPCPSACACHRCCPRLAVRRLPVSAQCPDATPGLHAQVVQALDSLLNPCHAWTPPKLSSDHIGRGFTPFFESKQEVIG
jgi:hypothetical protein